MLITVSTVYKVQLFKRTLSKRMLAPEKNQFTIKHKADARHDTLSNIKLRKK